MSRARKLLLIGPAIALAGLIVFTVAAKHARAEDDGPLWRLVRCDPGKPCIERGRPIPYTACTTDMVGDTIVAPPGARLFCVKVLPEART